MLGAKRTVNDKAYVEGNKYKNNGLYVLVSFSNSLFTLELLEQLSRPQFFPGFEIQRSFHRAKQLGKSAGNFQIWRKIVVLKGFLIYFHSSICKNNLPKAHFS